MLFQDRVFLLILLAGAALRLFTLTVPSLWFDEIRTLYIAEHQRVHWRIGHSGFYWIERLFHQLPFPADFSLRLFPALCGIAGIAVVYLLGMRLAGKSVGRWAAGLMAVNAFQLFFSQEARFYSAMGLAAGLAWFCSLRFFATHRRRWLLSALAVDFLAWFIHPTLLVFAAIHLLYILLGSLVDAPLRATLQSWFWPWRRQADGSRTVAPGPAALSGLALAGLIAAGLKLIPFFSRLADFDFSPVSLLHKMNGPFWAEHLRFYGAQFTPGLSITGLYAWFYLVVLLVGVTLALRRWRRDACFALVLTLGALVMSQAYKTSHSYETKYVFFLFPAWLLFAAVGFDKISESLRRRIVPGAAVALTALLPCIFSAVACYQYFTLGKINEKSAIRHIAAQLQPEDYVVVYGHTSQPAWFYWDQLKLPAHQYEGIWWNPMDNGELLTGQLRALSRHHGRVWFIDSWDRDDPAGLQDWLQKNARLEKCWPSWIDQPVALYEINETTATAGWPVRVDPLETLPRRNASQPHGATIAGRRALAFAAAGGNAAMVYDIDIPTTASGSLEVCAFSATDHGAMFEIALDQQTIGILPYMQATDQWTTASLNLRLPQGRHQLRVHYLGDKLKFETKKKSAGQPALSALTLRPVPAFKDGNILNQMKFSQAEPSAIPLIELHAGQASLSPEWKTFGDPISVQPVDPSPNQPLGALQLDVPHNSAEGFNYFDQRPISVEKDGWVYFSAQVRTEHLFNQSINFLIAFFDENEVLLPVERVLQTAGLSDDLNVTRFLGPVYQYQWVTLAGIMQVPPLAKYWTPAIAVYPNSIRQGCVNGRAWVANPRLRPLNRGEK